ncbi:MAG: cation transporter [Phenylobacterium sp.]|jgi:cation diffusion facilitator family transporter|uniref:cation diffusion facilitator family transporter n=1 Tax=Phenylobacterium sp. TaxID=1871053 RepID=UPI0025EEDAA9|nr:cation diffusion facilitator family transporter [Phenylobacterium sp.]MCA3708185.1 cation transporter [Phenylobacterium sp.]MCA3714635.1 cation transporter [Phenylobacterium sp.]MCA3722835.1 cation transporter [Phenylobacterium sp.]MCA3728375.1 cation transporter [Phenylobacterium sp.]MCA3736235.1 cation transporter [Phenylobacterium sp.]
MSSDVRLSPDRAAALTRGITLMSVGVATLLVTAKAAAWMASGSVALLASLADSTLDLVASTITFFAVRYAAAPPDDDHRFGHGKAEAFASLMQAGLVFASAALVGQEAIRSLLDPQPLEAGTWALAVMVLSTVMTFVLISAQTWVLRRTASVAVSGDRAHYASDLASNLAALAGIGASAWLGVAGLDGAAALVIAALLLWGAIGVFREAAVQLMDQELPAAERARIVELVTRDPRLTDVHQLRTRASGPYVHMQMHVDLDPLLTLEDAHRVIVEAERRLLEAFPMADILIHPDPRGLAEPHGGAFAEATAAE